MAYCLGLAEATLEEDWVDDKGIGTRGQGEDVVERGRWRNGRYGTAPVARGERGGQRLGAGRAPSTECAEEAAHSASCLVLLCKGFWTDIMDLHELSPSTTDYYLFFP